MNKFVFVILLCVPIIIKSQDLIIMRNGEKINCLITKEDSLKIYYDFQRGERKLSSFVNKNELRSYQIKSLIDTSTNKGNSNISTNSKEVLIDTSKYVKPSYRWNSLVTYSQRFGIHSSGFAVQYYGYLLQDNTKWIIPCIIGIESFSIYSDYFAQFNYQSANISYWLAGISPFRRIDNNFYFNIGFQLLIGEEQLTKFDGTETTNSIFGIVPSQGIYFIPKSEFGLTLGVGLYEKILSSEVFKNDIGIKFEIGIKF